MVEDFGGELDYVFVGTDLAVEEKRGRRKRVGRGELVGFVELIAGVLVGLFFDFNLEVVAADELHDVSTDFSGPISKA